MIYSFVDTDLTLPEYVEGTIQIFGPISTKCDLFEVIVYKNGLEIKISSVAASRYLKSGQLIFALAESNDVVSVLITDLTQSNLDHVIAELIS